MTTLATTDAATTVRRGTVPQHDRGRRPQRQSATCAWSSPARSATAATCCSRWSPRWASTCCSPLYSVPSPPGPNTTFGLPTSKEIMVAMATFGAMWAALSATAPRLARDREGGWSDYLATTPLRAGQVLAGRVAAGLVVVLPAVVAVGIAGVVAHGVHLAAWQWAADLGLLWAGTVPFVALGITIGSLTNSTVAFATSTGLWFAFAALGGLWVPPGVLSVGLRHFATGLPSYNQAALGWHVTSGTAPSLRNVVVLVAWTVGLSLLPLAARRQWPLRRVTRATCQRPASAAAIELCGLVKQYGDVTAVDGLDLEVPSGQIVALLGPNGAGKTTTMAVLLGLRRADGGEARLFGTSPRRAAAKGEVGAMLQDGDLMAGVGVGELLCFVRSLYPAPLDLASAIGTADLAGLLHRRTDRLSGGQAQRARFALAMVGNPALLVLDEPTASLDVEAAPGPVARPCRPHPPPPHHGAVLHPLPRGGRPPGRACRACRLRSRHR